MIDEPMEELACLYALGALSAEETRAFEGELQKSAELRELVATLSASAGALAGSVELITPPAALRAKILAEIEQPQKIVPLVQPEEDDEEESATSWFPWALAACFAVLCGLLLMRQNSMHSRIDDLSQLTAILQSKTNGLQTTVATLQATNSDLQRAFAALQSTNNELHQALAELEKNNNLANVKITVLGALLPDEPKAVAVSLWNEKDQTGEFVAQSLAPLAKDQDYQLWVIDPQYATPVDAGVFRVDDEGKVRVQFKTKQPIKTAAKFAVTREAKGGSPTPKGQMVLLGG